MAFVVHFVEVICGDHVWMHLMCFGLEFGSELGRPQEIGSLVEDDRVVDGGMV